MNDPARPLHDELRRFARLGFGALDVTLEPPGAWPVERAALRALLRETGLPAVGHTAYYLPVASPLAELERAALELFRRQLEVFAAAGVHLVNVHPQRRGFEHAPEAVAWERNAAALARLCAAAEAAGCVVMVENLVTAFQTPDALGALFAAAPAARLHLDVGHAHAAGPGILDALLGRFADRLAHVHVHDNDGTADQHLALGAGSLDVEGAAAALRRAGYDGTVTIEVYDEPGLLASRERWLAAWEAVSRR